jgi:predicted metal-dependent hydrolase
LGLFDHAELSSAPEDEGWRVRVSGRARTLRIQVYPHGGVEIVAPKRTRPADIEAFVAENREWILKTRSQFKELRPPEPTLPEKIVLLATGETLRTHFTTAPTARCKEQGGLLNISAPELSPEHCWPILRNWLKKKGKQHLVAETDRLADLTGLQPANVHIRLQRTRWGSCSSSGTISLNAASLLRPAEEMRYVIVHELCHLRHMNHSKRYWQLVAKFVPNYRKIEQTLDAAWQTSPRWLIG